MPCFHTGRDLEPLATDYLDVKATVGSIASGNNSSANPDPAQLTTTRREHGTEGVGCDKGGAHLNVMDPQPEPLTGQQHTTAGKKNEFSHPGSLRRSNPFPLRG